MVMMGMKLPSFPTFRAKQRMNRLPVRLVFFAIFFFSTFFVKTLFSREKCHPFTSKKNFWNFFPSNLHNPKKKKRWYLLNSYISKGFLLSFLGCLNISLLRIFVYPTWPWTWNSLAALGEVDHSAKNLHRMASHPLLTPFLWGN